MISPCGAGISHPTMLDHHVYKSIIELNGAVASSPQTVNKNHRAIHQHPKKSLGFGQIAMMSEGVRNLASDHTPGAFLLGRGLGWSPALPGLCSAWIGARDLRAARVQGRGKSGQMEGFWPNQLTKWMIFPEFSMGHDQRRGKFRFVCQIRCVAFRV